MAFPTMFLVAVVLCLAAALLQGCESFDTLLPSDDESAPADGNTSVVLLPPYASPLGAAEAVVWPSHQGTGNGSSTGCGSGDGSSTSLRGAAQGQSACVTQLALEGFRLLKELRAAGFTCPGGQHFPPNSAELEFDCRLWRAALGHSQDMGSRNYFSHVSPEGKDPFDRSEPYGLPTFNENLAAGSSSAAGTLEQWKNSDGHCRNMMDARHTRVAVAFAYAPSSTYKHYWTQLLVQDDGAVHRSCYTSEEDPVDVHERADDDPEANRTCGDSESVCQDWERLGYCEAGSMYAPFMHSNCRLSCGLCNRTDVGPGSDAGSVAAACEEHDAHCPHWASLGYCEEASEFAMWMQDKCKVSCGVCTSDSDVNHSAVDSSGDACQDSDSHCPHWKSVGYCEEGSIYATHTRNTCELSCG
eukprot:CAMPEP_0115377952 /NCGR_PEP_ID=MMETSP0271-20121206/3761_1 /TAXON_ID=71861 /ORGANISM="Scrippsiella trochoidea, Strain CCMP3099" /LENGTH=413 /DNA_ID=CAMNT_0002801099 /DNA_START=62 /DNA_END=1300 /DNA_ORIENTATION=-